MQQARKRRDHLLRPGDEAQGSQAAAVLGLIPARYVLANARIVTLDPATPAGRALAVGGGRILAIGSVAAMRARADRATEWIDCDGATVLPGLIDPHLHLHAMAAARVHLDCRPHRRVGSLLAAIAAHAAGQPAGAWVRGDGLDDVALDRLPTPAELDRAAAGRPVRLRHRSLHASLLGATALRRLARGRGLVCGTGMVVGREEDLRRVVGPLPPSVLRAGLRDVAQALVRRGVTTVADATPRSRRGVSLLAAAMDAGEVPLRVCAMRSPGVARWRPHGRLFPGPVKIVLHEEGAALRPRAETLARLVARAAARGDAVAVHCLGATALVAALSAFARLPRAQRVGRGHRLEHVAECPPPLVAEIAALGLTVVSNPAFLWYRGDVYRREASVPLPWLYRLGSLRRAGIAIAAGSDAPVVPADPWTALAAARTRRTRRGHDIGLAERIGAHAAIELCTSGAAYAVGAPELGRLRVGGAADLTVVSPDPLRAPPEALRETAVRLTMVDGAIAWRT